MCLNTFANFNVTDEAIRHVERKQFAKRYNNKNKIDHAEFYRTTICTTTKEIAN